jgi:hypothetical protein
MVGVSCRINLLTVVTSFQSHLNQQRNRDPPVRPAAVALCHSIRSIRFPLQTSQDLEAAIEALQRLSPLQPMIKDLSKKSALQHAMCDTLTEILRTCAAEGAGSHSLMKCPQHGTNHAGMLCPCLLYNSACIYLITHLHHIVIHVCSPFSSFGMLSLDNVVQSI